MKAKMKLALAAKKSPKKTVPSAPVKKSTPAVKI